MSNHVKRCKWSFMIYLLLCYSCRCVHLDLLWVRHLWKFLSPLVWYLWGSKCKTWKRAQNLSSHVLTYVRKPLCIIAVEENEFKIRSDCSCALFYMSGNSDIETSSYYTDLKILTCKSVFWRPECRWKNIKIDTNLFTSYYGSPWQMGPSPWHGVSLGCGWRNGLQYGR